MKKFIHHLASFSCSFQLFRHFEISSSRVYNIQLSFVSFADILKRFCLVLHFSAFYRLYGCKCMEIGDNGYEMIIGR